MAKWAWFTGDGGLKNVTPDMSGNGRDLVGTFSDATNGSSYFASGGTAMYANSGGGSSGSFTETFPTAYTVTCRMRLYDSYTSDYYGIYDQTNSSQINVQYRGSIDGSVDISCAGVSTNYARGFVTSELAVVMSYDGAGNVTIYADDMVTALFTSSSGSGSPGGLTVKPMVVMTDICVFDTVLTQSERTEWLTYGQVNRDEVDIGWKMDYGTASIYEYDIESANTGAVFTDLNGGNDLTNHGLTADFDAGAIYCDGSSWADAATLYPNLPHCVACVFKQTDFTQATQYVLSDDAVNSRLYIRLSSNGTTISVVYSGVGTSWTVANPGETYAVFIWRNDDDRVVIYGSDVVEADWWTVRYVGNKSTYYCYNLGVGRDCVGDGSYFTGHISFIAFTSKGITYPDRLFAVNAYSIANVVPSIELVSDQMDFPSLSADGNALKLTDKGTVLFPVVQCSSTANNISLVCDMAVPLFGVQGSAEKKPSAVIVLPKPVVLSAVSSWEVLDAIVTLPHISISASMVSGDLLSGDATLPQIESASYAFSAKVSSGAFALPAFDLSATCVYGNAAVVGNCLLPSVNVAARSTNTTEEIMRF